MKKFNCIFFITLFLGCSTEKAKDVNQATKFKSLFEVTIIESGSTLKISSEKYSWSKTLNSKEKTLTDIQPKFIVDSINKVAFFNLFDDSLYSIGIEDGKLKQRAVFPKVRTNNFSYSIDGKELILSSNQNLFIFNEQLKLIVNARERIEIKELHKAGAIFGDTIDVRKATTPQRSILSGSNYNLGSISLSKNYQDSILIRGHFSESNKPDTVVEYIIYKK